MTKVTDEMLMALADGELDRETTAEVVRAVDSDPLLAERLAEFRHTRSLAKEAFAETLDETVPERLLAAASLPKRRAPSPVWRKAWLPAGAAIAASIAGFLVASLMSKAPSTSTPWLPPEAEIAAALDKAASGEKLTLNDGRLIQPTATYTAAHGVCRSFAVAGTSPDAATFRGVACRHDGGWQVELAVAERAHNDQFIPASDRATQSIDAFLDATDAGESLDGPTEERLRKNGWRTVQ